MLKYKYIEVRGVEMYKTNIKNLKDEQDREQCILNWKNKIVRHFKGDLYLVEDVAEHTETGENMVVYRALYGDCKLYVRPLNMFLEECTVENKKVYNQENRFERVVLDSVKK